MRTRVDGANFGLWKRVIGSKTLGYISGELGLLVLPFLMLFLLYVVVYLFVFLDSWILGSVVYLEN